MNEQESIIDLQDVVTTLGKTKVHRGVSFSVRQGEVVTILGPSGSGKTVLLRLIVGLIKATSGMVSVLGRDMSAITEDEKRKVRVDLGMLFQGAALFDSLSVFENVAYGPREHGEQDEQRLAEIVHEKLTVVGLPGIESKLPSELSGGQRKRVGLARAIATSPKIMLYDEPTTGLDPTSTRKIDELIMTLRDDHGISGVAITHDIASARRFSDRWLLVKDGRIAAEGLPKELEVNSSLVASFVNGKWEES